MDDINGQKARDMIKNTATMRWTTLTDRKLGINKEHSTNDMDDINGQKARDMIKNTAKMR